MRPSDTTTPCSNLRIWRTDMPSKGYRKCRYKKTVNGKRIPRSHYVWNMNHPDNPVMPGEIIHHIDHNHQNDDIVNLAKLPDSKHRREEMQLVRRLSGPVKCTTEQSISKAVKMNEYFLSHPDEYAALKERRRIGTIAANKRRAGEKRSPEWKAQRSLQLKEQWKNGKRSTDKIFGRRVRQNEGNCCG